MKPSTAKTPTGVRSGWQAVVRITLPNLSVAGETGQASVEAIASKLLASARRAMEELESWESRDGVLVCQLDAESSQLQALSSDDEEMLREIAIGVIRGDLRSAFCVPICDAIATLRLESERRGSEWSSGEELARVRIGDGATHIRDTHQSGLVRELVAGVAAQVVGGVRGAFVIVEVVDLRKAKKDALSRMDRQAVARAVEVVASLRASKAIVPVGEALFQLRVTYDASIIVKWEGLGPESAKPTDLVALDTDRFRRKVDEELKDLPQDFEGLRAALRTMHEVSRSAIASAFEEALNRQALAMPSGTYEEKKIVANWVNEEARMLGLALRCPRTRAAALLRAQPGGPNGRFAVEVTDERGKRHHTSTTAQLPRLELRPDELSRAPWGGRSGRSK